MRPHYSHAGITLHVGDALAVLRSLPDGAARCCVTSPPYWGLRDYGVAGQLGLEATPDLYVARMVEVFREVRRVLADDGTLWLNLGDSYAGSWGAQGRGGNSQLADRSVSAQQILAAPKRVNTGSWVQNDPIVKPKDLVGIPWRVAFALQQPYYTGTIRNEVDRVWLAAMLDAEGCLFIHKRKAGQHNGQGYYRQNDSYGPGVEIANTSLAVVERIMALVGKGSICSQGPEQNGRRRQTLYRWNLRTIESRDFVREVYPYLVAKQRQARILYGCPSSGDNAEAAHAALKTLHQGGETDVDFPAPPPMFEPGFYLRSDVIWSKLNPMPESVRDRPTKAHEYLFLLSKQERYFYDAAAIAEPATSAEEARWDPGTNGLGGDDRKTGQTTRRFGKSGNVARKHGEERGRPGSHLGASVPWEGITRNARSVWTITTQPYPEAHFATFPEELPRRCILAGTAPGDTALDPFAGSGTTLAVAKEHNRRGIGIELNSKYADLAEKRLEQDVLDFGGVA